MVVALIVAPMLALPARADGYGGFPPFVHEFGTGSNARATSMALASPLAAVVGTMRGGSGALGGADGFLRLEDATFERTIRFGTAGTDRPTGVATSGPRFAVVGRTTGSFGRRPNAGGTDGFVRVYNGRGELRWARSFGTSGDDIVTGVNLAEGVIVTGSTTGAFPGEADAGGTDAFVTAFTARGDRAWTRQFGSDADDAATGISMGSGRAVISGTTSGDLPAADATNAGGVDAFLATIDRTDGTLSTIRQFGTAQDETTVDVDTISGWDFVAGTTDGGYAGQDDLGGSDGYVASFWNTGGPSELIQFGTDADDRVEAIVTDGAFAYAAGTTAGAFPGEIAQGRLDGFVSELDTSGNVVWTDQFGGEQDDMVTAVTTPKFYSVNGWAYVAGSTDHAAFLGFRTVPRDARAKADLVAALAIAQRWAEDHDDSFAGFTPSVAYSIGYSFAWRGPGQPDATWAISIADARPGLLRLANLSAGGTFFCLQSADGVVTYGQSEIYDGGSCTGGW